MIEPTFLRDETALRRRISRHLDCWATFVSLVLRMSPWFRSKVIKCSSLAGLSRCLKLTNHLEAKEDAFSASIRHSYVPTEQRSRASPKYSDFEKCSFGDEGEA